MMSGLLHDIRGAGRSMLRRPGFAVIGVVILALGIGSVTAVFSALHAVVLQPLPYDEPDRLVWVWSTTSTGDVNSTSGADYFDFREHCAGFSDLGAILVWTPGAIVTGRGEPERVETTTVSASFFSTLGVSALHGRSFLPPEEVVDGPNVVIVDHHYWYTRLGGDPLAVGQNLTIDGLPCEVVGVMPEGFAFRNDVDMWFPMRRGGGMESGRGNNNFFMIGRLADGVGIDEAQAQIDVLAAAIAAEYPDFKTGWGARLTPLHERFVGDVRPVMMMLMAAVALVLLIVCANLSSLLLAKVMSRSGELALRSSLGASRWMVGRQLLIESMLLAIIGSAAGIALAVAGVRVLRVAAAGMAPRIENIEINGPVLLVALIATIVSGLLSGLVPAMHGARLSLVDALKSGQRGTEGVHGLRLRSALVVAQVALSVVVLIGAGLLLKSLYRLQRVDPGMDVRGVLTVDLQLPAGQYQDGSEDTAVVVAELMQGVRALPGVERCAAADQLPLFGGPYNGLYPADRPPKNQADRIPATRRIVTEGFFSSLSVPLLQGRVFETQDRIGGQPVTVISKALADEAFPNGEAIGRFVVLSWGDGINLEIIGVVGDVRDFGLAEDFRPAFYLPASQFPGNDFRLVVKTDLQPASLLPAIRRVVKRVAKDTAIYNDGTMSEWLADSTSESRFPAMLLTVFALIALTLAATGLYGVMAFLVAERTREVGIRVALGAGPQQVIQRFLWIGLKMAGPGLLIGLIASPLLARMLRSVLFATDTIDPLTYVVVPVVLTVVVLVACVIPATRALRTDPAIALRSE